MTGDRPVFQRVTIVGLGLIGGSLGMALRRQHLARQVIGYSRRASTLRHARQLGAIDQGTTSLEQAVDGAELVVLATPMDAMVPLATRLVRLMPRESILTDVGSTKVELVEQMTRRLPSHISFVGGHPLAGSEQRGIHAASPQLFDRALCILTPTSRTNPGALRRVRAIWSPLVERVVLMTPRRHDQLLATMSHLPHLLAWCLVSAASRQGRVVAPPSFLDMTRIAKSDPQLWDDVFFTNHRHLLSAIDRFDRQWHIIRRLIRHVDRRGLQRVLAQAKTLREAMDQR